MGWASLTYVNNEHDEIVFFNDHDLKRALNSTWVPKFDRHTVLGFNSIDEVMSEYSITFKFETIHPIFHVLDGKMTRRITDIQITTMTDAGKFKVVYTSDKTDHIIINTDNPSNALNITVVSNKHTGANTPMIDNHTPADNKDLSRSGSIWNEINYMSEGRLNKVYFRLQFSTLPSLKNINIDIYGYYSIPEISNPSQEPAHDCNIHIIVDSAGTISRIWVDDELIYSYDYNKIEISLGTSGIAFNVVRNYINANQTINPIHDDHDCYKTDNGLATLLYHINAGIPISLSRIIELCSSTISPLSDWIWTSLQISIKDILSKGMHFNAKQQFVMIYEKLNDNGVDNIIRFIPVDNFDFDGDILNVIPIK